MEAEKADMEPQVFNSFLDGTKSAVEMVAIANSCGLDVPSDDFHFLPCGAYDPARVLRNEPTGQSREMRGTVAAVAKRNLKAGEKLDGKGGFTVWGKALPFTVA